MKDVITGKGTLKYWWVLTFKRLLRSPAFIVSLFLILIFAFGVRLVFSRQDGIVRVLLVQKNTEDTAAAEVCRSLKDISNKTIQFESCDDESKLRDKVTTGYALAGYIFSEDFENRLQSALTEDSALVTSVTRDAEEGTGVLDELVFGRIYDRLADRIAISYADGIFQNKDEQREEFIRAQYEKYRDDEIPFRFEQAGGSPHPVLEGQEGTAEAIVTTRPVTGLIGVVVLLAAMVGSLMWYRDKRRGIYVRLSKSKTHIVHGIIVLIPTIVAVIIGFAASLFLKGFASVGTEALSMLGMTVGIFLPVFIVQTWIRSEKIYMGIFPIAIIIYSVVFLI